MPFCGVDSQQIVLHSFLAIGRFATLVAKSSLYRSPAWPDPADPPYVNAALQIRTEIGPQALLAALHSLETAFGRRRSRPNAPRSLDLDLIAYDDIQSVSPALPHPRFRDRDFVLAPICEIAPNWRAPGGDQTAADLLDSLPTRTAQRLD